MTAPLSTDLFCEPAFAPSVSPQYFPGQPVHQQVQAQQQQAQYQQQMQQAQTQYQQAQGYTPWGQGAPQNRLSYAGTPASALQNPGQFQFPHAVAPAGQYSNPPRPLSAGSGNPFGQAPAASVGPAFVQAAQNPGLRSSGGGDSSFARGLQQVPMPIPVAAAASRQSNGNPFA